MTSRRSCSWLRGVSALLLTLLPLAANAAAPAPESRAPNVLFIAVDDLNHWVRHLGRNEQAVTPNLDRLAARGVTFTQAHCAAPACNPSRTALMSGLRPSSSSVYHNPDFWEPHIPRGCTMNEHFRANGYEVLGVGKIYHGGGGRLADWDDYGVTRGNEPPPKGSPGVGGIKFAPLDCRDEDMVDYEIADYGIRQLGRRHEQPFFLAVGFRKPHMPWNVPRKYYDLFPLERVRLVPYREDDLADVPPAGLRMAKPEGDHARMLESGRWKEAIQAYLATCAFVDGQIGRVIKALDQGPNRDNTIIVLWGDHGWHLGEKQHWRKFALWEEATRAPLLWVAPGVSAPGGVCHRPVDFMTLYPTLCDLTGVPAPKHLEGASIRKLLVDPAAEWDLPALTTHGFRNHAVRTGRWRYIRYENGDEELYDHTNDPYEWTNLAGHADLAAVKAELQRALPTVNAPPPAAAQRTPANRRGVRQQAPVQ